MFIYDRPVMLNAYITRLHKAVDDILVHRINVEEFNS